MLTETAPAYCSSESTDTNTQFQMEAQEQRPSFDSEETPSTGGFLIPSALEKINSGCLWKYMRRTNLNTNALILHTPYTHSLRMIMGHLSMHCSGCEFRCSCSLADLTRTQSASAPEAL